MYIQVCDSAVVLLDKSARIPGEYQPEERMERGQHKNNCVSINDELMLCISTIFDKPRTYALTEIVTG